jgi:hypothetical protein
MPCYTVLLSGDFVAHNKFTILLMPNEFNSVTSHILQDLQHTKTIYDPEIKAWLALGIRTKKKGGGKKKIASLFYFFRGHSIFILEAFHWPRGRIEIGDMIYKLIMYLMVMSF